MKGACRAIASAALVLGLSACNPFAGFTPSETEILRAGFVERDRVAPPKPVFCYATLAEVDCFRTPRRGEDNRLVGAYLPVYVIE